MNGKQEGVGIYYNARAEVRYGRWVSGKRISWIQEQEYHQAVAQMNSE